MRAQDIIPLIYFCIKFGLIGFWLPMLVFAAVYTTFAMLGFAAWRRLMNVIGLSAICTWVTLVFSMDALGRAREAHDIAGFCATELRAWAVIGLVMSAVVLAILQAHWVSEFWRPTRGYRRYLALPMIAAIATFLIERAGDYHASCVT